MGARNLYAAGMFLALGTGACSPTVDVRGNMPDPDVVSTIKVGQTNKAIVQELLGSPSTVARLDRDVWLYIGERTETVSFWHPTVLDRKVVAIHFDTDTKVTRVDRFGLKDGKDVDLVDRETPTKGKELGFVEQLIGNIGRFNSPEDEK